MLALHGLRDARSEQPARVGLSRSLRVLPGIGRRGAALSLAAIGDADFDAVPRDMHARINQETQDRNHEHDADYNSLAHAPCPSAK